MKDPKEQFQIGDEVTYLPEGVRTIVTGYLWTEKFGGWPQIGAYVLGCGITVSGELLERAPLSSRRIPPATPLSDYAGDDAQ